MNARDILGWWMRQIRDLLPIHFHRAERLSGACQVRYYSDQVIIRKNNEEEIYRTFISHGSPAEPDGDDAFMGAVSGLHDAMKGMVAAHGVNEAILYPGEGALLERDVAFPMVAEKALDRILSYEMDRLTPFAAADVVFGWAVRRRDTSGGRIHIRLSVVPLAALRGLPAILRASGVIPVALEISRPDSTVLRLPLTRDHVAGGRVRTGMLSACMVLAVIALMLPFVWQQHDNAGLERQMAALGPDARAAEQIRQKFLGGAAGQVMVHSERQRLGDPLAILAALTNALPDGTYLTDMTLQQGQLLVSGRSPVSTRVIQAMSANPVFTAPAFAAPVTRTEGSESSQFSIRAGIPMR